MTFKRTWEDDLKVENGLTLLSRVGQSGSSPGRVFNCKTCNKSFKSFQALGGHRTSHKRPKTEGHEVNSLPKAKTHECSVCGLEFAVGQALGGHMRRHRDRVGYEKSGRVEVVGSKLMIENGAKKGLCLDLNLTPYV